VKTSSPLPSSQLAAAFVAQQERPMRRLQQTIEAVQQLAQHDLDVERGVQQAGRAEEDAEVWPRRVRHGRLGSCFYALGAVRSRRRNYSRCGERRRLRSCYLLSSARAAAPFRMRLQKTFVKC
jgi:hypothetical protein